METQQLLSPINDCTQDQTIDTPSKELLDDLRQRPRIITRSLIPLDNTLPSSRRLGFFSTLILFIGRILGSGIFATPGLILKDSQGSYSLYLICWIVAGLIAYSGLYLYLELGSYLPVNGATKKFLEYIFPRPLYMTTMVFGLFTLLFSLSCSNALVFAEYLRYSLGYENSEDQTKKLACCFIILCGLIHGSSKTIGIKCQNVLGTFKLFLLAIIVITCFYVLILPSSLTKLPNNLQIDHFKLPSSSSALSGSLYATALLKCIHSLGGWTTSHTVQNEIKDPIKTLKLAGPLSIVIIIVIYTLLNLCYLIIIPYDKFINTDQLVGAMLFTEVYGNKIGSLLINLIVSISSATNVLIVIYTDSIMNQEIFKEGFLPFSDILSSNKPFGTPLFGIIVHVLISCLVICIPQKSVYNHVITIQYYPNQVFHSILCFAVLFKLRKRFDNIHAPIRAPTVLIYICLIGSLSVVISPFISGDFKFTLASYGILGLVFIYWLSKTVIAPYFGNYTYRTLMMKHEDGSTYKKWIKNYNDNPSLQSLQL